MTLIKEADEICTEVSHLPECRGRKYGRELRDRVLEWMERARLDGMNLFEMSRALGIDPKRLDTWRREAAALAATTVPDPEIPRGTAETAMIPVSVRGDDMLPWGPSIAFSVPGGSHRGLALDQALGLLRLFA